MSKRLTTSERIPFRPDLDLITSRDKVRSDEELWAILGEPDGNPKNDHEDRTPPENAS